MRWIGLIGFTLSAICTASAQPANSPDDVQTIIQRSVEATARDWKAAPGFSDYERDLQPDGGTRTYQTSMIEGSPYNRLVAVNGKPLSPQQQAQEQQKLDAVIAQRRNESPQQRADRIAKYEKDRKRNQAVMEELAKAFDFVLTGEQKLDGFDVYVLKATPRHGYKDSEHGD